MRKNSRAIWENEPDCVKLFTTSPNNCPYQYDANGNMTCREENGQTWKHTYNDENRLSVNLSFCPQPPTFSRRPQHFQRDSITIRGYGEEEGHDGIDFGEVDWINVGVGVLGLLGDLGFVIPGAGQAFWLLTTAVEGWNIYRNIHLLEGDPSIPDITEMTIDELLGVGFDIGVKFGVLAPGAGFYFSIAMIAKEFE